MLVVLLIRENLIVIKLIWVPQLKRRKSLSWQCIAWNFNGRQKEKTCACLFLTLRFGPVVKNLCGYVMARQWFSDRTNDICFQCCLCLYLQRVGRIGGCGPSGRQARPSMASSCTPRGNGMETEMTKVRWKNHPVLSLQFFFPSIAFLSILELC